MEFYLKYDGPLKGNDDPVGKHCLRRVFYSQFKKLWSIMPLCERKAHLLSVASSGKSILKDIEGLIFAPLVTTRLSLTCELDITLLWPEEAGNIVKNSGDIDNRLKTLFDALACPDANQVKTILKNNDINQMPQPFFCLLEDDKLITSVKVRTATLLTTPSKDKDVSVLIEVRTKRHRSCWANEGL